MSSGKLTTLLVKRTGYPVDVCLGVLIILVLYYTVLYLGYIPGKPILCPQRNLGIQLHMKSNIAGRNVYNI